MSINGEDDSTAAVLNDVDEAVEPHDNNVDGEQQDNTPDEIAVDPGTSTGITETVDDQIIDDASSVVVPESSTNEETNEPVTEQTTSAAPATKPAKQAEIEEDFAQDERSRMAYPETQQQDPGNGKLCQLDSTLSCIINEEDGICSSLRSDHWAHLVNTIRGSLGAISGRYAFETRIISIDPVSDRDRGRFRVLVGVSAIDSCPFINPAIRGGVQGPNTYGFDFDGWYFANRDRTKTSARVNPGDIVTIVLNLDPTSLNFRTLSAFRNGFRISTPQALPESYETGTPLFPTFNFKGCTVATNMGGVDGETQWCPLPFTCRMWASILDGDGSWSHFVDDGIEEKGKRLSEVVWPIGLPDEGTFDWVDEFAKETCNRYMELSDRKMLEWIEQSGNVARRSSSVKTEHQCIDRPEFCFSTPGLFDSAAIRKITRDLSTLRRRNYLWMDVKGNLIKAQRTKCLQYFNSRLYKKVALVVMGEPPQEYKDRQRQLELQTQQAAASAATASAEETPPAATPTEPPPTSTEEVWFRKKPIEDLTQKDLSENFINFSLPTLDEGFDEIRYIWQDEEQVKAYLKDWMLEHKITQYVHGLKPSQWFKERKEKWMNSRIEWRRQQREADSKVKKSDPTPPETSAASETSQQPLAAVDEVPTSAATDKLPVSPNKEMDDLTCADGTETPLFKSFDPEDWALMNLKFELHLLIHSFSHDVGDPERIGIHENLLPHYYREYFNKSFCYNEFGCSSLEEVLALASDTITVQPDNQILVSKFEADDPCEKFVQVTEATRREREALIAAGKATKLDFASRPSKTFRHEGGRGRAAPRNRMPPPDVRMGNYVRMPMRRDEHRPRRDDRAWIGGAPHPRTVSDVMVHEKPV
eukprot:GHVL01044239.1.p1 GENE.GHVL01044239.1~~GHVL01044239.1.p1  ORF type:complete len:871 (+),score=156.93 GHVL01044239.1:105-2717(+)